MIFAYCECGWRVVTPIAVTLDCPSCDRVISINQGQRLARSENRVDRPPSHWPAIHQYPVDHATDWNAATAKAYYDEWCLGIPSYNCSCQSNWKAYTATNPPDLSSAKAFFDWSVDAHNYVSTHHARRPTVAKIEADGLYKVPWATKRPRAIVTLALDDHKQILDITLPMMATYADRVGAELHVIDTNLRPDFPMANKWRLANYARNFEQTLYLDSDVLVMPDAPNIYTEVPSGFAARDERPDYHYRPDWYANEMLDLFRSQGVEHELRHCANGGVLLMTDSTYDLYEEPPAKPYSKLWCTDQYWLSYRLETTDKQVTWLDDRWNWGFIRNDWWRGLSDAWFIHLNGSRPLNYRLELAKRIKARNFEKYLPPKEADWAPKHD